jgi:heme-degrading monooxygenase HmoA
MSRKVLYMIHVKIPVKIEEQWNKWHNNEHIPMISTVPGFLQVRKFRCLSNNPQEADYFVVYELRNREAYDLYVKSEEGQRIRQHYLDAWGSRSKTVHWACEETFTLSRK